MNPIDVDRPPLEDPLAELERQLISAYLKDMVRTFTRSWPVTTRRRGSCLRTRAVTPVSS